jgi:hypothetical protein
MPRNKVLEQVASLGEGALGKLAQNPTTNRAIQSAMQLRERVDDLSKRVRGLEALEQRIERLEKRLDRIERPGGPRPGGAKTKSAGAKKTSAAKGSGSIP